VGSDHAGAVAFTLRYGRKAAEKGARSVPIISNFRFATPCAPGTARVRRMIQVGSNDRFHFPSAGITIAGSVHLTFDGSFFGSSLVGVATGTAGDRTSRCDSGRLKFTADRHA
jgi:hypothetical protein